MDWNTNNCDHGTGIPDIACITPLFQRAIGIAVGLVGTVSLLLIIYAGIKYITSGGGKGVEEAQKILTYAIIGLLIVLFSFFIVGLIAGFTGVQCLMKFGIDNC
jgi:hypothetical protein